MTSATEAVPSGRDRVRRGRRFWLRLLLLAALVAAAVLLFDLRAVGAALVSVPPAILVLALVLATLDRCLMGIKWRQLIVAGGERIRVRDAVSAYYQSSFTSRLVPAAAAHDLLRAWVANRSGVSPGLLAGSIPLEKLIGMLASVMVAGAGLCYLVIFAELDARAVVLLAGAVLAGAAVGAAALILAFSAGLHRRGGRLVVRWAPRRLADLGRKASAAALNYRRRRGALAINFGLAVVEHLLQISKLLVLAIGVGVALPLVPLLAIIALATYARRIFAYVESWGIAEASGVATFVLLGIDPELAFAMAVGNYAITTIAVLPGAYLLYRTGTDGRSGSDGAAEPARAKAGTASAPAGTTSARDLSEPGNASRRAQAPSVSHGRSDRSVEDLISP